MAPLTFPSFDQEVYPLRLREGSLQATKFAPVVVLGHGDLASISNRALLLQETSAYTTIINEYMLENESELSVQLAHEYEDILPDVKVTHLLNNDGVTVLSVVCVLAHVPSNGAALLAVQLLDLMQDSKYLTILTSYHFPTVAGQMSEVHATTLNSSSDSVYDISTYPRLPVSAPMNDCFLGALLNGLAVEGLHTTLLAVSSRRPNNKRTHTDECLNIRSLQKVASELIEELNFDFSIADEQIATAYLTHSYKVEKDARAFMYQ
eukprot:CFRG8553T1